LFPLAGPANSRIPATMPRCQHSFGIDPSPSCGFLRPKYLVRMSLVARYQSLYYIDTHFRTGDMHWVYVIRSRKTGTYHIDTTGAIEEKLEEHNKGKIRTTQLSTPWELVFKEGFENWTDAVAKEKQIQSIGIGRYLRSIGK
jgi:putative endonuclease